MDDAISRLREKAQNEATCFALNDECKHLRQQLAALKSDYCNIDSAADAQAAELYKVKQQLAECQKDGKHYAHEYLIAKDALAECQRERDAYKAKAVIADIPMSDVEARLKEQLATVTKERDELKANSDRYELLRDMKLYEMQQYNCLPCALEDSYDWFDEQTDAKIRERYPRATIGADKAGEV